MRMEATTMKCIASVKMDIKYWATTCIDGKVN